MPYKYFSAFKLSLLFI